MERVAALCNLLEKTIEVGAKALLEFYPFNES